MAANLDWDKIKNDVGWALGLILLALTQIQPFLNWVSSRRGNTASAKKDEASASAETINADSNRNQTMAQSAQMIVTTATAMVEQLEKRLQLADDMISEYKKRNDELGLQIQSLMAEMGESKTTLAQMRHDIERLRVTLNDTEILSRRYHERATEALTELRNLKRNFSWMMQGVCPPDEEKEDLWLLGDYPLRNKCDDQPSADQGETRQNQVVKPGQTV